MLLLLSTLILSTVTEALRVIGGNLTVVQGETAILPCKLIDATEPLTQISWQKVTRGKPQNVDFCTILASDGPQFLNGQGDRFAFVGNFDDSNGTLQLSNVTLMDEGIYTCIFTLFPSGNHKTQIPLNLLVPPLISLKDNLPTLGNEEVSLVTCTAAGSKPPAEVTWLTGTLAERLRVTTDSIQHDNGTTTTVSSLFGVPTREISLHLVKCVISVAAMSKEEIHPFTIQVYFSPMEVLIIERSGDVFECVTEANPKADFTWKRINQSWPQSAVRVDGAKLHLLSMTSDLNGLFQCEASNPYGKTFSHLSVHVTSGAWKTGWILFGLLLFLNVVAVLWYSRKCLRTGGERLCEWKTIRKTSSTPEESHKVEEEEAL